MMSSQYFYHPDWPVLHEDNHLLGLYKPAGLLVQGDQTGEPSLLALGKAWLKERYNKPGEVFLGLVHRLDRPVAGVVLFCRTSKAAGRVSEQFRLGKVEKHYLAVVEGRLKTKSGRLVHQIERYEDRSSRIVGSPTGVSQEARLSYELLDTEGARSLVHVILETGRRHQIRVQMAQIGHPILGDLRYGASAPLPQKQIALFARQLVVSHPVRKDDLCLQSPLPRQWPWPGPEVPAQGPLWNWNEYLTVNSKLSLPF
jgi:23S rRNA pseudouridine1911/1915/1917 synthase